MAGVDRDLFTSTDEPELEFDDDGTELSSAKEGRPSCPVFWICWASVCFKGEIPLNVG